MKMIAHYGFLEVWSDTKDKVVVSYGGNMGNRLEDVRKCFDARFGKDRFYRILAAAKVEGSPDYMWSATLTKSQFWDAIVPERGRIADMHGWHLKSNA
jgi:hypothetical protein